MNERKARELIEKHFVEPLPASKLEQLREHLASCPDCKARFDELAASEGGFDGAKAGAERSGARRSERGERAERKPWWAGGFAFTWPFPTVIAGAAAALLLVTMLGRGPRPDDAFRERGAPKPVAMSETPELLAACFRDEGKGPQSPANLTSAAPYPSCPRGGRIALAYRRAREGDRLAIFALRGETWSRVVPAQGQEAPLLVAGPGTSPLPGSFAIDLDAPAGEVRLVAIFTASPELERLGSALAAGQTPAEAAGAGAIVQQLGCRLEAP